MRRPFVILPALALLLSTVVGSAQADTGGGCSGATQCRTAGQSVDASWSGVPLDGPVIGAVYTDTYVSASESMTSSRGVRTSTGGLWFSEYSYVFDGSDKPNPTRERFVTDFGGDVVVKIDAKLRTATIAGTVMVVTCTYDADWNELCGDPVATLVRGTWTATGPAFDVTSSYKIRGPGLVMNDSFTGTQREATASATIGGVDVAGIIGWASISNGRGHSISICHAPSC